MINCHIKGRSSKRELAERNIGQNRNILRRNLRLERVYETKRSDTREKVEKDEARDCTMCSGMAGVRCRSRRISVEAHRRIRGGTLAALPRINKREHRWWVVVGGSAAVAARRASENDADDVSTVSPPGQERAAHH